VPKRAFQVTVEAIERLTPTVKVFRLGFAADAGFDFVAGQYVMVDIPRDAGILQKAYSIASSPLQRGSIDLCIKLVEGGYASTYFHRAVEIGTTLTIHEAQGTFVDRGVDRERLYVAAGTGIAPIRSMIQALYATGFDGPMWLFFGVRYEDEILYEAEWRRLAAEQHRDGVQPDPVVADERARQPDGDDRRDERADEREDRVPRDARRAEDQVRRERDLYQVCGDPSAGAVAAGRRRGTRRMPSWTRPSATAATANTASAISWSWRSPMIGVGSPTRRKPNAKRPTA